MLYSRTLLFIHSKYNSLHLPTPDSRSVPPHPPGLLGNHTGLLSMSASPFVLETGSRVSCFRLVASLVAWVMVKNPPAMQEIPGSLEDPLEKGLATHSTSLPGEFHRQRSLAGYSPWGCKESDVTEHEHNV